MNPRPASFPIRVHVPVAAAGDRATPVIVAAIGVAVSALAWTQIKSGWDFVVSGVFFSTAIGILLLLCLRARETAATLARSKRERDAKLAEHVRRDQELHQINLALERRVDEHSAELSEALRELEGFCHAVSHDLRSPLGAIVNYSAVLDDGRSGLTDEDRRVAGRIREAAQRAAELLNRLVEFGSSGTSPLSPETLDMKPLVEGACSEVAAADPERESVRFEIGRLPSAYGDPLLVHRIFVNLLGNALEHSRGRPLREVRVGGACDAGQVTFWVKDNGPGLEPARLPEIFKPFRRPRGGGGDGDGIGLGLSIVAKAVRRQGGRVWAESDGRSGAEFYFTLPSTESRQSGGAGKPASRRHELNRVPWAPRVVG